jgi:hypothetical protein
VKSRQYEQSRLDYTIVPVKLHVKLKLPPRVRTTDLMAASLCDLHLYASLMRQSQPTWLLSAEAVQSAYLFLIAEPARCIDPGLRGAISCSTSARSSNSTRAQASVVGVRVEVKRKHPLNVLDILSVLTHRQYKMLASWSLGY